MGFKFTRFTTLAAWFESNLFWAALSTLLLLSINKNTPGIFSLRKFAKMSLMWPYEGHQWYRHSYLTSIGALNISERELWAGKHSCWWEKLRCFRSCRVVKILFIFLDLILAYTLINKGASRCHRITFLSNWFHKEPLTSEEPFCFTKGSLWWKKVLQIIKR